MTTLNPACPDFTMPGEFEPHSGTILIWPERPGSWSHGAMAARKAFSQVIETIAQSELVYVAVSLTGLHSALSMLLENCCHEADGVWRYSGEISWRNNVILFLQETDDAWARDVGPTFLVRRKSKPGERKLMGINWQFNAWGGEVDGLYARWDKDDAFAAAFCDRFGFHMKDATPFVLEGGSIHSDGEGTLLTTESCLLSAGRNPTLCKIEIERQLQRYLGIQKVLWLPRGIYGDETNEHVDNVCAFLSPGHVVLAWSDNPEDPQYDLSHQCLTYLENVTDAKGRNLTIHRLPIPDHPICIQQEDLEGYEFEDGEDCRELGERLAASYVNFYFTNDAVLLPVFGGDNKASDCRAVELMTRWLPNRKIIPIPARAILTGGGNIHCITQQIPKEPEV